MPILLLDMLEQFIFKVSRWEEHPNKNWLQKDQYLRAPNNFVFISKHFEMELSIKVQTV